MSTHIRSDVLLAGTWLQVRDVKENLERTALLLRTVALKDRHIASNKVDINVWCPISGDTFETTTTCVTQVLGRVQFPTPDRSVHLRVDPSQR